MVTQALASTTEDDLLKMMITVRDELSRLISKHTDVIVETEIDLIERGIENGQLRDMASY